MAVRQAYGRQEGQQVGMVGRKVGGHARQHIGHGSRHAGRLTVMQGSNQVGKYIVTASRMDTTPYPKAHHEEVGDIVPQKTKMVYCIYFPVIVYPHNDSPVKPETVAGSSLLPADPTPDSLHTSGIVVAYPWR
jgi:hypothetical protein